MIMMQHTRSIQVLGWTLALALTWVCLGTDGSTMAADRSEPLKEVNTLEVPDDAPPIAIVGARLVDGRGGSPVPDAAVVVEGDRITAAGPRDEVTIPDGAERVGAEGKTILPGFIDAHFHSVMDNDLIHAFLRNGVTTLRDPGHPLRFYQSLHFAEQPVPRVYLLGAHLDGYPPVWPQQAVVVRDAEHARRTVHEHVDGGGTGIKIYYRLPLEYYEPVAEAAQERGVPLLAHLELVDADDAIRAGVEGIEHVTSFGTALAEPEEAQQFKDAVRGDNDARRDGRFKLWSTIDLQSDRVRGVIALALEHDVVISPTIALFDRRDDEDAEEYHVRGFEKMLEFLSMCHEAGVTIVVGSHTWVPGAERGWAYQRELELLVEAGMTPMEAIVSGTMENARYFRAEQRLGTIEPGKLADLVLVEGDPTADIEATYDVRRVMLNGEWVERDER